MTGASRQFRLGTRASALARWQAAWVATQLEEAGYAVRLVPICTTGDQHTLPLSQSGGTGVFTKALQQSLLEREIDLAVHSLKDLPTAETGGTRLAAVPRRADPHDVLVTTQARSLRELASATRIGTGSPRRKSQLLAARPDVVADEIRGNVETRLRKLDDGEFDALVMAAAGLHRLGLGNRVAETLGYDVMLPAAGQGALGIEIRDDDDQVFSAVAALNHATSCAAVRAERAVLSELRAGCLAPVGALARPNKPGQLELQAVVLSANGQKRIAAVATMPQDRAEQLGRTVADALMAKGAERLIADARPE